MALKSKPLEQVRDDLPYAEVSRGEIVRVNINVASQTRRAWKIAAVNENISVTELLERAVRAYLSHLSK